MATKRLDNNTNNTLFSGTDSAESLCNWGSGVTIVAGAGNDYIYNDKTTSNVTINAGSGKNTVDNNGINVSISAGSGDDLIRNWKSSVTIDAGDGNDKIYNEGSNAPINAGAGNDSVYNRPSAVNPTISTGAGNDTVDLWNTGTSVVNVSSGNKILNVYDNESLNIIGDAGNSNVQINTRNSALLNATLDPGAGNDTVSGTQGKDIFKYTSGNDVLYGVGGEDTLNINGGVRSATVSGNDVILTTNNGTITVKGAKGRYITVNDGTSVTTKTYGGSYDYSPQDVIQTLMQSMARSTKSDANEILDDAIRAASNGKYSSASALIQEVTVAAASSSFLRDKCGIELSDVDTGAITGWDAGGKYALTSKTIVPESGTYDSFSGDSFESIGGVTLKLEKSYSSLTAVQKRIVQGLHTWWTENALNLIKQAYGDDFAFDNPNVNTSAKTITVKFVSSGSFLAQVSTWTSVGKKASKLELQINMSYYKSMDNDDVNGLTNNKAASYLDRVLSHEFTHAIMGATINSFNNYPAYLIEGMAELTHGIDDERGNDIEKLAASPSNLAKALTNSIKTVNISGINAASYAGGFILLRYLANQCATLKSTDEQAEVKTIADADMPSSGGTSSGSSTEDDGGIKYNKAKSPTAATVTSDFTGSSIDMANDLESTVKTVDASTADIYVDITANDLGDVIKAAKKGSIITSGAKADKLYGNSGADTFVYKVDKSSDVIGGDSKATVGNYDSADRVVLVGSITSDTLVFKDSGSTTTVTFTGNGSTDKNSKLTITKDKVETALNFYIGSSYDDAMSKSAFTYGSLASGVGYGVSKSNKPDYTAITVNSSVANGTVISAKKINSQIKTINASSATNVISIIGNDVANNITLGSGGGTVNGGAGNDVLNGGNGADVFVYRVGEGNDAINNYNGSKDKIVLENFSGSIDTSSSKVFKDSGKSIVLSLTGDDKKSSKLTINSPTGKVKVYTSSDLTNPILDYGLELPDGVKINGTSLVIGSDASVANQTFDLSHADYPTTLKEINASSSTSAVKLIAAKDRATTLRAATAGSTLVGGDKADKLIGNTAADIFVYDASTATKDTVGGDNKFKSGNFDANDTILITSSTALTASDLTFTDKSNTLTIGFKNNSKAGLTITKADTSTPVKIVFGTSANATTSSYTYGQRPDGVSYGRTRIGADDYSKIVADETIAANTTVDAALINSQIRTIDASNATVAVKLAGNAAANTLNGGSGTNTMDGGAGNDILNGGSGTNIFFYYVGEGNDVINNYNGLTDKIIIANFSGEIDKTKPKVFQNSGSAITLNLTGDDKKTGKLTINKAEGKVKVYASTDLTNPILEDGVDFPRGVGYTKSGVTIGATASVDGQTFDLSDHPTSIKEINAASSTSVVKLIAADDRASMLRASTAGSTLIGGAKGDKLFGNVAADLFVYDATTTTKDVIGGDTKFKSGNFDENDTLLITSDVALTASDLTFVDKNSTLTIGFKNNSKAGLTITKSATTTPVKIVFGTSSDATVSSLNYGERPAGVVYTNGGSNFTQISVGAAASGTIDASIINSQIKTIDARSSTNALYLSGNGIANTIYAGNNGSTLNGGNMKVTADKLVGGDGQDVFVYNEGDGKDIVDSYNSMDGDIIKINGDLKSSKVNGNNVVLTIGNGSKAGTLTINNVTGKNILIETDDSPLPYLFDKTHSNLGAATLNAVESGYGFDDTVGGSIISGQMTASGSIDDYWFTHEDIAAADQIVAIDQIDSIVDTSDKVIGALDIVATDPTKIAQSMRDDLINQAATYSARRRK